MKSSCRHDRSDPAPAPAPVNDDPLPEPVTGAAPPLGEVVAFTRGLPDIEANWPSEPTVEPTIVGVPIVPLPMTDVDGPIRSMLGCVEVPMVGIVGVPIVGRVGVPIGGRVGTPIVGVPIVGRVEAPVPNVEERAPMPGVTVVCIEGNADIIGPKPGRPAESNTVDCA